MSLRAAVSPHGHLLIEEDPSEDGFDLHTTVVPKAAVTRILTAFSKGSGAILLELATTELGTVLPPSLAFCRSIGHAYLTRLCHIADIESISSWPDLTPSGDEIDSLLAQSPPMRGSEYLSADALIGWWRSLDDFVREAATSNPGGVPEYLKSKNPLWRTVGKVTFHLAENKRSETHPFAFLATFAQRLSAQGSLQHLPFSRAVQQYAASNDRDVLLKLLVPVDRAGEQIPWVAELVKSGEIYQALAWSPKQAHQFLQDIPKLESTGLLVRVPDWWKPARPTRPVVSVRIGDAAQSRLGMDALLDFSVGITLDDKPVSEEELRELLASGTGLVRLRGQWVEVDRDKLNSALAHWKKVEQAAKGGEISFFEGMRLLAGAPIGSESETSQPEHLAQWTGLQAGEWLEGTLAKLRDANQNAGAAPRGLQAQLRPYQLAGTNWLRFMTQLGLGACLADDMGLGKTLQTISLLLHLREDHNLKEKAPSLLVVPASLIANWKSELHRFAPSLNAFVAHPSENRRDDSIPNNCDLVITTYGMLSRNETVRNRRWRMVILDEAQAIKNPGTRQAKSVKQLQSDARIALTGTPVENRLSDLWSLFDFLNPGLLGSAKAFARFCKSLADDETRSFAPLRTLVKPYILRRLKTDKNIIADLPDKTELKAYCSLTREQAVLYTQSVQELEDQISNAEGIKRRGIVLAFLMRFKQICNHPSQWLGDGDYAAEKSGKLHRLRELCEELSERQEKVLIFTQFREMVEPLGNFLTGVFGKPGLALHGGTEISRRRERVEAFQRDDGPPFFVLSIKAGGTGLNLTAASQVIHFDRWWNPAVENQATDRAFRIGQKKNVLVHKFICRGTVEEKIDEMIADKVGLSNDLLEGGAEKLLTEMNDHELLNFVSLDLNKASEQ